MKKFLVKILVIAVLISGTAFALSACSSENEDYLYWKNEQPFEDDDNNDKNNETDEKTDDKDKTDEKTDEKTDDKRNDNGGIWTPPVKEN